jgi:hypothetical protein
LKDINGNGVKNALGVHGIEPTLLQNINLEKVAVKIVNVKHQKHLQHY